MEQVSRFDILINKDSRDYYSLSFPFNSEIIENIKKLEKREFDAGRKVWIVDAYNLYNLILFYNGRKDIFFEFVDKEEREKFIEKYKKAKVKRDKKEKEFAGIKKKQEEAIKLKETLLAQDTIDFDYSKYLNETITPWNYQIVGALFANKLGSCLMAADMGTGKSMMSILACEINPDIKKVLVIVPNSLKFNWGREVEKFTKQKYYILNEKSKSANKYTIEEAKYFIVNYEYFNSASFSFDKKIKPYNISNPDCLICDESHKLKNTNSNTSKNIIKYFKKDVESVLMLTGTPLPNRLVEIYVQLNFLLPEEFTSKSKFYKEYCGMVYNPYAKFGGWVQATEPDLEKMHNKLNGIMYRVRKKDVLKDLPDVQINKVYLKLTEDQQKEYEKIEQGFKVINWDSPNLINNKNEVLEQGDSSPLGILTKLRQYTSIAKLQNVKEFIEELNEEGEKVVTFDSFVNPLKELQKMFPDNSLLYWGGVDPEIRQTYVDRFQDGKDSLKNLFITTQTGNFGITLTQSSNICMLNQSFVPAEVEQSIARCHRIGQKNNVNAYIFIFEDTIDQYVDDLIADKLKVINKVVDGEDYQDVSNKSVIGDLMNMYKKKFK